LRDGKRGTEALCRGTNMRLLAQMLAIPGFFTYDLSGENILVKAGRYSSVYVDMKKTWRDPALLRRISGRLARLCVGCNCVVGIESGGSPYASLIAGALNVGLVLVRGEEAGGARGRMGSGYLGSEDATVAIVEDVVATGESAEAGLMIWKGPPKGVRLVSVMSYGMDELISQKYDLEMVSIFQIDDLLDAVEPHVRAEVTPYIRSYQLRLKQMMVGGKGLRG
jgi:orotate phosphoribosyltransferase